LLAVVIPVWLHLSGNSIKIALSAGFGGFVMYLLRQEMDRDLRETDSED